MLKIEIIICDQLGVIQYNAKQSKTFPKTEWEQELMLKIDSFVKEETTKHFGHAPVLEKVVSHDTPPRFLPVER